MKIKRFVNGKEQEFELTADELYEAFREQEHKFDLCDVDDVFNGFDDDELLDMYGRTRDEIKEKYEDIAYEMRRNIDKYEMSWQYARDAAIAEIL